MKKLILFVALIVLGLLAVGEYHHLYTLPYPEITFDSASYLSLKRAASSYYRPRAGWNLERDDMLSSGVIVGMKVNDELRIFLLADKKVKALFLDETAKKLGKISFSRGMNKLGERRMVIPEKFRSFVYDDEEAAFALIDITEATKAIESFDAEVKYIDLDAIGRPTISLDPRAIKGVGIAGWYNFTELGIGEEADVFAICGEAGSEDAINPYRGIWWSTHHRRKGNLVKLLRSFEGGISLHEADFPITLENIGSPVFAYGKFNGKEYPFLVGIVAEKYEGHALILPIERVRSKILQHLTREI